MAELTLIWTPALMMIGQKNRPRMPRMSTLKVEQMGQAPSAYHSKGLRYCDDIITSSACFMLYAMSRSHPDCQVEAVVCRRSALPLGLAIKAGLCGSFQTLGESTLSTCHFHLWNHIGLQSFQVRSLDWLPLRNCQLYFFVLSEL